MSWFYLDFNAWGDVGVIKLIKSKNIKKKQVQPLKNMLPFANRNKGFEASKVKKTTFERFTALRPDLEQCCGGVRFAWIGKLFQKSSLSYVLGQHSDSSEVENVLRLSSEGVFKIISRVVSDKTNVSTALLQVTTRHRDFLVALDTACSSHNSLLFLTLH